LKALVGGGAVYGKANGWLAGWLAGWLKLDCNLLVSSTVHGKTSLLLLLLAVLGKRLPLGPESMLAGKSLVAK